MAAVSKSILVAAAFTFLSLGLLFAHSARAEQPLYVGDFDGPIERKEYLPTQLSRSSPIGAQELPPAGFLPKMIPARAKSRLMCFKIESNSKGQLFIRPERKRVKILGLPESKVRFFLGSPLSFRKYDKRLKTANLDLVLEYPCYKNSLLCKLIIGFEEQVVRSAVVVPLGSKAEE